MGVIEDVFKALDRVPLWRQLHEVPREVDELKARIGKLEELVNGKVPGDPCPFCGAPKFRLDRCDMHGVREVWKCEGCGKSREVRLDLTQPSSRLSRAMPKRGSLSR
jgi:hypothetical protein